MRSRHLQAGLSLVEVMVAVLIGLIGILIITQAYITGDRFNRSTLGEGGAQTNGLIALYSVERDVRLSGYGIANSAALGCGEIHWYYDPDYSGSAGGTLPDIKLAPILITVTAGHGERRIQDADEIVLVPLARVPPGALLSLTRAAAAPIVTPTTKRRVTP